MVLKRALILTLFVFPAFAQAPSGDVDFDRYPAPPAFVGRHAAVKATDLRTHRYRDALADAADHEVDFAGRYVIAEIGCGASCIMVAAIDAETGVVTWLRGTVSNWPKHLAEPLEYRVGSRLLVVHGQIDEKGSSGPHVYVFDGRQFAGS